MRISTWCTIWLTLGLFANYFSLKSLSLSLKSHMNVLCALKLTELWNTSLLFQLNYKYINGSLAFSPGQIYILRFRVIPFGWSDQDLDLRSLGSWCVRGTSGSLSGWDFAVPLMHHDPSDTIGARGSGILNPGPDWSRHGIRCNQSTHQKTLTLTF